MESKRRTSGPKSQSKGKSPSKGKEKRIASPAAKESARRKDIEATKNIVAQLAKKPGQQQLVKKKIEDLKAP